MMKELTIIIPFRNEGEQVYKTCESFNRHCDPALFDILCLNDCSEGGYDYSEVTKFGNVTLVDNEERMGVAGSRDKGVKICTTKYVLLVDGHMRVFGDVVTPLLEKLHEHPGDLLCCQSRVIQFNKGKGAYEIEKKPQTKGVTLCPAPNMYFLNYDWGKLQDCDLFRPVIPIQCCMGACYAMERDNYLYLHGLNGLQQWGMDEQFLSAKVWMAGGRVLLLKDIEIAHIYRAGTPIPYTSHAGAKLLNQLIVAYLLGDPDIFSLFKNAIEHSVLNLISPEAMDIFNDLLPFLAKEKTYLQLVLKYPFAYFLNLSGNGRL